VIVDKGGEKIHKDKKLNCKEREKYSKGESNQSYDIGKGSIKIEHTSRGSQLMNVLLHLYVH
jgi:hypothetical protein